MTTLTRDTTKDVEGHGNLIDENTLYNITDDTDVSLKLLQTIYPVGAIYIGTMNICPLSALFGTWELVGAKILTDVTGSSSVPVKGNGLTLGLQEKTNGNLGLTHYTSGYSYLIGATTAYGTSLGTSLSSWGSIGTPAQTTGITTDSSKSGIIADISNSLTKSSLTVNIFRRTA